MYYLVNKSFDVPFKYLFLTIFLFYFVQQLRECRFLKNCLRWQVEKIFRGGKFVHMSAIRMRTYCKPAQNDGCGSGGVARMASVCPEQAGVRASVSTGLVCFHFFFVTGRNVCVCVCFCLCCVSVLVFSFM